MSRKDCLLCSEITTPSMQSSPPTMIHMVGMCMHMCFMNTHSCSHVNTYTHTCTWTHTSQVHIQSHIHIHTDRHIPIHYAGIHRGLLINTEQNFLFLDLENSHSSLKVRFSQYSPEMDRASSVSFKTFTCFSYCMDDAPLFLAFTFLLHHVGYNYLLEITILYFLLFLPNLSEHLS